jgi:hypothetical protein
MTWYESKKVIECCYCEYPLCLTNKHMENELLVYVLQLKQPSNIELFNNTQIKLHWIIGRSVLTCELKI